MRRPGAFLRYYAIDATRLYQTRISSAFRARSRRDTSHAGVDLVEDAAFTLVRGRRYALVGRNGKGKSTLLQAVAARRVGSVPEACAVHYVHQDIQLSTEQEELRPVDLVLAADVERRVLLSDRDVINSKLKEASPSEAASLTKELQKVLERLETCEADSAARRADELLQNLGFSEALRKRKMRELSGGWRVRTFLASALFARPDVLLLDEPTNHLSIAAVLWLARELTTSEVWACVEINWCGGCTR